MPWTKKDYPNAMKNLPAVVRHKAIEIANAILEEGKLEEGAVIAIAISKAKETVAHHRESKTKAKKD